jgi:hypothetical protein
MIPVNIIIFILIGTLILVLAWIFRKKDNYNLVPRKIWTYWDNSDNSGVNKLPKAVKLCMESWKKFNPDYEIVLLTKKNFQGYVTIPDAIKSHPHFNDSPGRFSDLLKLYALEEHGGIWMDASILVKKPFDEWLFPKYAEFSGFYKGSISPDKNYPVVESWFLAANKNSKFIKEWKQEFLEIATFKDIPTYLESRGDMGINIDKLGDPHYLAIYVAALKVFHYDKYPIDSLILRNSEEGPLKYLRDGINSEKGMRLACSDKKYQSPLMKMGAAERDIIEKEIDYDLSVERCGWLMA